jgi:ribonuclease Z
MTCSVRILTTHSLDSFPSILLISPDGSKTLVNCGEGCQRSFLEFRVKLTSVNRICLTHHGHDSINGLPGMILTSADTVTSAMENAKASLLAKPNKRISTSEPSEQTSGLELIGPTGTRQFLHSLRHFMRREKFDLRIQEGAWCQTQKEKESKNRKEHSSGGFFHVQSLSFMQQHGSSPRTHSAKRPRNESKEVLSFLFTSPPIPGKFRADKAKALDIPKGPLYGELKSGKAVTFLDEESGCEKRVESHEVVEPGCPGVAVAVIYYPSHEVLEQIQTSIELNRFCDKRPDAPILELLVHMAPRELFLSDACQHWMQDFGKEVEHIFLEIDVPLELYQAGHHDCGTPFRSAAMGALARSLLSPSIYRSPEDKAKNGGEQVFNGKGCLAITEATPLLEYVMIPLSKKGFSDGAIIPKAFEEMKPEAEELVQSSGAANLAHEILHDSPINPSGRGELLFTGTGSAVPCKDRNVSGIYLRMENGNAMLLDVGEGTTGQILRAKHGRDYSEVLRTIKAVWISHPHADHHLGLLRLLAERHRVAPSDPLVLIAPPNLSWFLNEYEVVDPSIFGSYLFLNCYDIKHGLTNGQDALIKRLQRDLGIDSVSAVQVTHCRDAFAVIIKGTSFGCLAYSGDCRPSVPFAKAALDADLLIHEATFEDGMEAEANLKRHSTVGEALEVAKQMRAKNVVLTHFSQRYPRIPPINAGVRELAELPSTDLRSVIFAFDFMTLTPANLVAAYKLTPALRLLYPEEVANEDEPQESSALKALEIPGLFAQKEIL